MSSTEQGSPPPGPSTSARPVVAGLGPHGERPATADLIGLSPDAVERARARAFRVGIALHTTASDWSKRQIAGIETSLRTIGALVVDVVDCAYDVAMQGTALARLMRSRPDAVISIPVGGSALAETFRAVSGAGIKLVLLDNAPPSLVPEVDYVSVVSSDNFGLGQIAAELLSPHIPHQGAVCVVAYKIDFFATAQREIAFSKWMRKERPDIALTQIKFETPARVSDVLVPYLDRHPSVDGLFVVWDEPAVEALAVLDGRSSRPVMTTVDLGQTAATALADGVIVKGVAAQRPFEQGCAAATCAIAALLGQPVPPWIVLPGFVVTAKNVLSAYQAVGGAPASPELLALSIKA